MNPEVEPCDDFYDFACGGFLETTSIPDDKTSVNTFTEISDELQNQLRASIEEKSAADEPKPFRLAKNLYKACMNKSKHRWFEMNWSFDRLLVFSININYLKNSIALIKIKLFVRF